MTFEELEEGVRSLAEYFGIDAVISNFIFVFVFYSFFLPSSCQNGESLTEEESVLEREELEIDEEEVSAMEASFAADDSWV